MSAGLARKRILAEAGELFLAHGAEGVTMRGLAARMGVTPMALYRHFDNRGDLLGAIVEEGHTIFLGYLHRALTEPTPEARLQAAGRHYLAFALDHPRSYAIMFMEHVPQAAEASAAGSANDSWGDAATFRFLVDRIRDCADAGVLGIDDAERAALTVWVHVHGLVSLFLAGKLGMEREAFESFYVESVAQLVRGYARSGGGSARQ
jgi:AcrR family transcriptional regulator